MVDGGLRILVHSLFSPVARMISYVATRFSAILVPMVGVEPTKDLRP